MAFIGVRSSWLTRERNSDFAWLAASARSRAMSSSAARRRCVWSMAMPRKPLSVPLASRTAVIASDTSSCVPSRRT